MESDIKDIYFDECKLNRAEFINVNLKDVDLSSCDINGIIFDMKSLRGIIIDRFQCDNIATMFGVKIKE